MPRPVRAFPALISAVRSLSAAAAEPHTEHTWRVFEGEGRPAVSSDDAAFLVGSWQGTAFGERVEESWATPSGGTMLSTFKLFEGGAPAMHELLLLSVEDGTGVRAAGLLARRLGRQPAGFRPRPENLSRRPPPGPPRRGCAPLPGDPEVALQRPVRQSHRAAHPHPRGAGAPGQAADPAPGTQRGRLRGADDSRAGAALTPFLRSFTPSTRNHHLVPTVCA